MKAILNVETGYIYIYTIMVPTNMYLYTKFSLHIQLIPTYELLTESSTDTIQPIRLGSYRSNSQLCTFQTIGFYDCNYIFALILICLILLYYNNLILYF